MLSAIAVAEQKWGQWVNPDLQNILKARKEIRRLAIQSSAFRKQEWERCKIDPIRWINLWVWSVDPRLLAEGRSPRIPLILFEKQKEYIQWRRSLFYGQEIGIVQKSRDSGMSWLNIADQAHHFIFDSGFKGAFGSRKEMLIDRLGDPDCLFEKLRFLLDSLPGWMKPEYKSHHLKIINAGNGSMISGEAGDNIGRGGRNAIYDIDECAWIDHFKSAWQALSQNTKCIILTSTPRGTANTYYELVSSGRYPIFTFHWRDDPRKNEAWYQKECNRFDEITIAQEIDIDYAASMEGAVIPAKWVQASVDFFPQERKYAQGHLQAGCDIATTGSAESTFLIQQGSLVWAHTLKTWKNLDPVQSAFQIIKYCKHWKVDRVVIDQVGVGEGTIGAMKLEPHDTEVYGFKGSWKASNLYWEDEEVYSHQKFANARAEAWELLRERFRKTYLVKKGIQDFPAEELISIPNDAKLITQLSALRRFINSSGKIQVESKQDLEKRGIKSPDRADALCNANYLILSHPHSQNRAIWS